MSNYAKIGQYAKALPGFLLAFTWAKERKKWNWLYPKHDDDVLQEIAVAVIESNGDLGLLNKFLTRRLYLLAKYVLPDNISRPTQAGLKLKRSKPKTAVCEVCLEIRTSYFYVSIVPGKMVCARCYKKIKYEDERRNR